MPGHGHNGLKGYAHGLICGVAAMMPRRSKKQERLAGKREVEDQRHD